MVLVIRPCVVVAARRGDVCKTVTIFVFFQESSLLLKQIPLLLYQDIHSPGGVDLHWPGRGASSHVRVGCVRSLRSDSMNDATTRPLIPLKFGRDPPVSILIRCR